MRPTLILLCGVPGSGKTTYSRKSIFDGFVKLSNDDFLLKKAEEEGISYQQSFSNYILQAEFELTENFKTAVSSEENIILDQMNLTPTIRRKRLLRVPPETYNRVAVNFNEPNEVIVARNRERIKTGMGIPEEALMLYISKYTSPNVREGFDEIWNSTEIPNL